jgi:hypothetical protein
VRLLLLLLLMPVLPVPLSSSLYYYDCSDGRLGTVDRNRGAASLLPTVPD